VAVVVTGLLLLFALAAGLAYHYALPDVRHAKARVRSSVLAHGGTIGHVSRTSKLAEATVAVEDDRFYGNAYVNVLYGAARATLGAVRGGADAGGSTLPQQLAKLLYYGTNENTPDSLKELALGLKLSNGYSRGQVLNMYLNAAYFGHGYWGATAAARGYFGVAPSHLSWSQAAMLAGLLQAPSAYDPVQHLKLARERQRHVLDRLVAEGRLSTAAAQRAYATPLHLRAG
jgi:membrane peptidoglycan carboxypeptidase